MDKIDYIVLWSRTWLKSKHGEDRGGSGLVQSIKSRILVIDPRMVPGECFEFTDLVILMTSWFSWLSSSESTLISMGPWKRDYVLIPHHHVAWWLPGSHLQNSCPIEANDLRATMSDRFSHAVPERYEQKRPHRDGHDRRSSQGEGELC